MGDLEGRGAVGAGGGVVEKGDWRWERRLGRENEVGNGERWEGGGGFRGSVSCIGFEILGVGRSSEIT